MESKLIVKCSHCGNYYPIEQVKVAKLDEGNFYLCVKCIENLPSTSEEQILYVHKK